MRRALLLAAAVAACGRPAPADHTETRYISIGTDALEAAERVAHVHGGHATVLDREDTDGVAVVAIDDRDLGALSQVMHEEFGRCGGFMLHDSLDEARAFVHAHVPLAQLDYTLDRADLVTAVLPALDAERIRATIAELSAMRTRYYESATGAAASTWLRDRWRSFSTRTDVTVELVDHGWPQKSVILTIPGTTRASEVVVLGGHLDSISPGAGLGNAPGADDDASGIATLTEVARVLLASDVRPERTIKFIAYAAEEVGLRGSQAIVRDFKAKKINVVGALQLDMTNYQGSDKDIWLMKDFTSAPQNTFMTRLIDTYVGATWGMDACGYGCSDHASWYRAGVPASMPFEARFRDHNKRIHTKQDTLETSGNNANHALKFARLGAAYAIELAKADAP